ncbi:hypothetical protein ACT3TH_01840 [Psychrobacter sp. AOP22-C1-C5]|uniref:hypothetical protein n=1 Tax=Psychrobacter sp. AOP22-C1-C5 TaxID=3457716 RepID=UPI0040375274
MSDQDKLTKHKLDSNIDADNSVNVNHHAGTDQEIRAQQVSIKSWTQKILVVLLCMASFYGGWKSYESNAVSECRANGGQMIEGQKTMLCQLS